jgi:glycosyltransferase involved in cell wall biosynthesis
VKILVIHEIDYLEKVIYEIQEFPELLALEGHEVTFFHFQEEADRGKKNLFRTRVISGRTIPEAKLTLVGPHQFGIRGLDRLWATLSCWPALYKLFRNNDFDVVLNFAVPTYGLQALILSKFFNVPFIHRALDSSHEIRESIFKYPILWVEKLIYRFSPLLSANNSAMLNYCVGLSGRKRNSVINYPPLALDRFSNVQASSELRENLLIQPSDKVITYMGSFFYFSGLPAVVQRFSELVREDEPIKLLLVGGGEQDDELRDMVLKLRISDKVVFTGLVTFDDLPSYLSLSNVAINPLEIGRVASIAFPNKVLQYLATGLTVVSTRLEGLVSALDGTRNLIWANSPEEVLEKALEIVRSGSQETEGRDTVERLNQLFSPRAALSSLEETLALAIELNGRG